MSPLPRPPRLFEWLLGHVLPDGIVREDIVGSLAQEFDDMVRRRGRRRAAWWYRWQALGVALRALRAAVQGGDDGARGGWEMRSLGMDLKFAARALRRSPAPYLIAIVTIALGVGVNAAMFSVVNGVLLSPLPYPDADRLVRVWPEKRWSIDMLADVRAAVDGFEPLAGAMGASVTVLGEGEPEVVTAALVTDGWFEVLGAQPAIGRLVQSTDETAADGPVAVLSHGFWERRFGADPGVVGRTLALSGQGVERRTVVGVLPAGFEPFPFEAEVWLPWVTDEEAPGYAGAYGGTAIARMRPGVSVDEGIARMRALIPEIRTVHSTQFREIRHSPVDVVPLLESIVRDVRTELYMLLGAVGFVLLIACANVANLLLARTAVRRREIGLRLALGADRGRVLGQMVTESVVLGLSGGLVGLATAYLTVPVLRSQLSAYLPRAELVGLDVAVVLYALAVSLAAGLVFGIVPGVRAAGEDPASVLNDQSRGSSPGRRRARANDLLVSAEVALSLVLVVGAGLMLKSLWVLSDVDPGLRTEGVVSIHVVLPSGRYDERDARRAFFSEVLRRVSALPGVQTVASVNTRPLSGNWSGIPYMVEGQELAAGESIVGGYRVVSPNYFELLDIPLVEGRTFTDADDFEAENVALVDVSFVNRHWPGESALGRNLLNTDGEAFARVVGVVGDTRFARLGDDPVPTMYFPADQIRWNTSTLLVRGSASNPLGLFESVAAAVHEVDADIPVRNPETLEAAAADSVGDTRFYTRLLGGFAALALLLGVVGVYGVMSYAVSQRTREIGVRIALGSSGVAVLLDTLRRGMLPVLAGIGVGLVGAWLTSRTLAGLLFGVRTTDPWVYGSVAGVLALSGVAAILVPALRAMGQDPVSALREEM